MNKYLKAEELEALRPLMTITDERFAAVKAVLVNKETLQSVAERYGCSRQNISALVKQVNRITANFEAATNAINKIGVPAGFERVSVVLSSHHAFQAKRWEEEDKAGLDR